MSASKDDPLLIELTAALLDRNRLQADYEQVVVEIAGLKAAAREKRDAVNKAEARLREIEHELLTGRSALPLIAAAQANAAARNGAAPAEPEPDPEPPAPKRRGRKPAEPDRHVKVPGRAVGPWQQTELADVLSAGGISEDRRSSILAAIEFQVESTHPTIEELCLHVQDWDWEGLDLDDDDLRYLKSAIAEFRIRQGWTDATAWPDGIPAAWLDSVDERESDQGGADEPPAKLWWECLVGHTPLDLATMTNVERALVACLTCTIGADEAWASLRARGATDAEITAAILARGDGGVYPARNPADGNPGYIIGTKRGKTRFWLGPDYRFDGRKTVDLPATLEGQALVDAVRRVFAIPVPGDGRSGPAAQAAPAEPVPADRLDADRSEDASGLPPMDDSPPMDEDQALRRAVGHLLDGLIDTGATDSQILDALGKGWGTFRFSPPVNRPGCAYATTSHDTPRFFYGHRALHCWPKPPADLEGPALARAVRKLLKIPKSRPVAESSAEPVPADAPAADPTGTAAAMCEILHDGPPWTDEELDRLLLHACREYIPGMRGFWEIYTDPSDGEITFFLEKHWPKSRVFVPPDRCPQKKHGYTIQYAGGPRFWVGVLHRTDRPPTLAGAELIARIRAVMGLEIAPEIPEQQAKALAATAPDRAAERAELEAIARRAIEEVEGPDGDGQATRICSRCRAGFPGNMASCPACGWKISRLAAELVEKPAPADSPGGLSKEVWDALQRALDHDQVGDKLARRNPPPTDDDIMSALREAWEKVRKDQCAGYRVRTLPTVEFWVGDKITFHSTLSGEELIRAVRTACGLGAPPKRGQPKPPSPRASGAERRKAARKRKETA